MKLHIGLIIVALLVVSSAAYSQQANVGIKGGLNFYNVYDSYGGFATKTGFHAGLLWHMHVNESFAFQPELVYSVQGANLPDNEKLQLGYLNVPVLFQLMFNNGFRLEAGPQIGFLVHARSEFPGTSEDVTSSFDPFDAALAFGFGFIGASGLGFDVRYNHGISRINDDFTNRGFQAGLFYQFNH